MGRPILAAESAAVAARGEFLELDGEEGDLMRSVPTRSRKSTAIHCSSTTGENTGCTATCSTGEAELPTGEGEPRTSGSTGEPPVVPVPGGTAGEIKGTIVPRTSGSTGDRKSVV